MVDLTEERVGGILHRDCEGYHKSETEISGL